METRENECQIFHKITVHLTHEIFWNFGCILTSEIWHSFSQTPTRNFLWCYYRWLITSLALEKCKKECNILKIDCCGTGFCPLKISITQFPNGFHLNIFSLLVDDLLWDVGKRINKFKLCVTLSQHFVCSHKYGCLNNSHKKMFFLWM